MALSKDQQVDSRYEEAMGIQVHHAEAVVEVKLALDVLVAIHKADNGRRQEGSRLLGGTTEPVTITKVPLRGPREEVHASVARILKVIEEEAGRLTGRPLNEFLKADDILARRSAGSRQVG